ncbi:MAG: peptidase M48 [Waddliaceae bacterium]|nr:peptidase M48 [Waddliaceae bacterium]
MNFFKHACLLTAVLLLHSACGTNMVTGKREFQFVSEEKEIQMGQDSYLPLQQIEGGEYLDDPALLSYIKEVTASLISVSERPNLPYSITIINSSTPNAWALPGGKIGINRGLLLELNSEAELAAVLSHEIVHAAARHSAKALERQMILRAGLFSLESITRENMHSGVILSTSKLGTILLSQTYSRAAELEADRYGIEYMVRAGYDPFAAVKLQETFIHLSSGRSPGWLEGLFASHPPSKERLEANKLYAETFPKGGKIAQDTYKRKIARLRHSEGAYQLYDKAQTTLSENNPRRALQITEQALQLHPQEALFHGLAGKIKGVLSDYQGALFSLDRALSYNPHYYDFYLQRGLIHRQLGNLSHSRADLNKSITLLPTADAYYALGRLAVDEGNSAEAQKNFAIASNANTNTGQKATRWLARMEIPHVPEKYLQLKAGLDNTNHLILEVQNQSVVSVKDVHIQVEVLNPAGRSQSIQVFKIGSKMNANDIRAVSTQLGPFSNTRILSETIRASITSAKVLSQ